MLLWNADSNSKRLVDNFLLNALGFSSELETIRQSENNKLGS